MTQRKKYKHGEENKLDQRRYIFYKSPFSLLVSSDENNTVKCGECDFPTNCVIYFSI